MEQSTTKRAAKNLAWLFFGNGLNGIMMIVMTVYIARVLGAGAFGLYQFAQAFLLYLLILVDNGLSILGTREIAREERSAGQITLNLFVTRLLVAGALYLLAIVVIIFLPIDNHLRWLFLGTFLFVFYRALNSEWVFQGLERMQFMPLSRIIVTALTLIMTVWLIRGPHDLIRLTLVQAACGVAAAAIFLPVLFRWFLPVTLKMLTPHKWPWLFWQSLPLGASIFLIQVYNNLDTIMLGFMDRVEVVGYYNAAYKIFYACLGLFSIWLQIALPIMSRRMANDRPAAGIFIVKYFRVTALVFIPLALAVFLLAPSIVRMIFGPQYLPAVPALQILIWQLLLICVGSIFGVLILIPAGRYYDFLVATGTGAIVNIIFNFLLIPRFSMIGAAAATLLAEISAMLMCVYFARRIMGIGPVRQLLFPAVMALAALPCYWIIMRLSLPLTFVWQQAIAGTVYLSVYCAIVLIVERNFIFGFIKEIRS